MVAGHAIFNRSILDLCADRLPANLGFDTYFYQLAVI